MNLTRYTLSAIDAATLRRLTQRSAVPSDEVRDEAMRIVRAVRDGGDRALIAANERFGGGLPDGRIRVTEIEMKNALAGLPAAFVAALEIAIDNIRTCHDVQRPTDVSTEVSEGVTVHRRWAAISRAGAYVPGGQAVYPSSLLMTVVPALVAGVASVAVMSPADGSGAVSPALLGAAALAGVQDLYVAGGAQAIAALAYGTETVERVDKIVGPGNAWMTAAKLAVYGDVGIDLPAGPSEAVVVADNPDHARFVAADLICQAEHGPDSVVALVTTSDVVADAVLLEIERQLQALSRSDIIRTALADHGIVVVADSHASALQFAQDFAPEHLSLHTEDPVGDSAIVTNAGSVFLGPWAPESVGDYATGANHVLPTGGLAAAYGPLSVEDFGSWRQVQEITREGLATLRPVVSAIAEAEGLTAHRAAVDIRFAESETERAGE